MGNTTSCCGGLGSNDDSATELRNKTNDERNAHLANITEYVYISLTYIIEKTKSFLNK